MDNTSVIMRKLALVIFLATCINGFGQTLIDSYPSSNYDQDQYLGSNNFVGYGQSFTTTGSVLKLSSCKFYLVKVGSQTGAMYAKVYAHSGTYGTSSIPTGSALATSDVLDI